MSNLAIAKEIMAIKEQDYQEAVAELCLMISDYFFPVIIRPDGHRTTRFELEQQKDKVELLHHKYLKAKENLDRINK